MRRGVKSPRYSNVTLGRRGAGTGWRGGLRESEREGREGAGAALGLILPQGLAYWPGAAEASAADVITQPSLPVPAMVSDGRGDAAEREMG